MVAFQRIRKHEKTTGDMFKDAAKIISKMPPNEKYVVVSMFDITTNQIDILTTNVPLHVHGAMLTTLVEHIAAEGKHCGCPQCEIALKICIDTRQKIALMIEPAPSSVRN